ncbi:hypothetical protein [Streptomyces sp. NPDC048606]|uniref:hypothetical protein n=1 Tax=Streptomyces sp. NPDC048606 TaxID=3154726 RepID=UPI0034319E5E
MGLRVVDRLRGVAFEEDVRARPERYFGVERDSPELPTEVLQRVVWEALHRRDGTHGRIGVEITSDLGFTVEEDRPHGGFGGSPLDEGRWAFAAAAALCVRTVVEVRPAGCGLGPEPARRPYGTRTTTTTTTTFDLDPSYFGPGEAIAWALRPEELHGEGGGCRAQAPPVTFPIHDLRAVGQGRAADRVTSGPSPYS